MTCKEIALSLCAEDAPSGMEGAAAARAAKLLSPLGKTSVDALGSVVCTLFPPQDGQRHYLLDAHIDEIGLMVTDVTDEGFLRVANVGGVDRRAISGSRVRVHGTRVLPGFVCTPRPYESGEQKNPKMDDVRIDIGLAAPAAREAVHAGDRVTFCGAPRELANGLLSGKALDNRAGCAVLIRAAQLLQESPLHCGVTIALSVQEETGGAGARTSGWPVMPTHAIVVDVTFGRTPDAPKQRTFLLGGGPTIVSAPVLSKAMSKRMAEVAAACGIPFGRETEGGRTGTNADAIAELGAGVCTASLGIPLKYMHTPVELLNPADMEHAARLIVEYLKAEEGAVC